MKAKARENLEAALRLLEHGLLNAAASRLYFAAFQAAVHALAGNDRAWYGARQGPRKWSHGTVEHRVAEIRGLREDHALFCELRLLRETADYETDSVPKRRLDDLRHDAARFVHAVTP